GPGGVYRFTKLIPAGPGVTRPLNEAAEPSPELRALARQDERVRKVLDLGARIEGLARHASVHAAGVVIAPGPLTDYVPVCLAPQEPDAIITQYDMVGLEKVGMLKIDILGLKTLTVIHDATEMVLEEILAPTYGVITYQEQVMRIANVLAGFSLAEADVLRKAVGKKDRELIQEELGRFVERAVANGHARRVVEEIAAQIATFGRYG